VLMESIVVDKEEQSGVTLQKTDDLLADITPSLKMIQKVNKDQKEIYYSTWEECCNQLGQENTRVIDGHTFYWNREAALIAWRKDDTSQNNPVFIRGHSIGSNTCLKLHGWFDTVKDLSDWTEKNGLLPEDEKYDCEHNQTKHDLNADASETEQNLLKTHIIKKQKKINKSQV
jgi:hypothetical protein